MRCVIDTETRSRLDIGDVGPTRYFTDPSTEVVIVTWQASGMNTPALWQAGDAAPLSLFDLLADNGVIKAAVNSAFDAGALAWLTKHCGWPRVDPDSWSDIAARAAALNYPRALAHMIPALGLPASLGKLAEGRALIRLFCRPARTGGFIAPEDLFCRPADTSCFVAPEDRPEEWRQFRRYAVQDTVAAAAADAALPELAAPEHMLWRATERMNLRGVGVDIPLVKAAQALVEVHVGELGERFFEITGLKPKSSVKVADWLRARGLDAPNATRSTLEDLALAVSDQADPLTAEAIAIRQDIGAAAVSKLATMLKRNVAGRLHDEFLYMGAPASGRWSGRGCQLQNLARPRLSAASMALLLELLQRGAIDLIRRLFVRPVDDLGSAIRSMLVPSTPDGLELFDFRTIEFKILCWCADQAIPQGDPYRRAGAGVFGKPENAITTLERQIAKALVLGSGYLLSAAGFQRLMKRNANIMVSDELAVRAIATYRQQFPCVPRLWKQLQTGFAKAYVSSGPVPVIGGRASYQRLDNDGLGAAITLVLPSGRRIYYRGVELHPGRGQLPDLIVKHNGKGGPLRTSIHAGHLTEHVVSGASRDLLARAMILADRAGLPLVATVHDELVLDGDSRGELARLMTQVPGWAKGADIQVEGAAGLRRYGKA